MGLGPKNYGVRLAGLRENRRIILEGEIATFNSVFAMEVGGGGGGGGVTERERLRESDVAHTMSIIWHVSFRHGNYPSSVHFSIAWLCMAKYSQFAGSLSFANV